MKRKAQRVFISDCEGPISKNDNAFELAAHFIPKGEKLFAVISRYDDVLAEIVKPPGYKAGDTLKLILPFFKAFDVTDGEMLAFSRQNLLLMPYAKQTLAYIRGFMPTYIVSTSYEHYIKALCETMEFPFQNAYCTRLALDKYDITPKEKWKLREIAQEIAGMPMIEIPGNAKSLSDLHPTHRTAIERLNEIFWKEIAQMRIGEIFSEVNPVGGGEKARAVEEIAQNHGVELENVMYVGDSITDVESFRLVRSRGGLTISFNGNRYAVREAEIAVLSQNTAVTSILAKVFHEHGRDQVLRLTKNWNMETLSKLDVPTRIIEHALRAHPEGLPKIKIVTRENMEAVARESSEFRKKVRGEAVGALG